MQIRRFHTSLLAVATSVLLHGCQENATVKREAPPALPAAAGALEPIEGAAVEAILTDAPEVPPPTHRTRPAKVIVHLEVIEVEMPIAEGVNYTFWTFGGHVPGKFIRVRQGDLVEFHLQNHPDSKMPHNIDLHAVTGPGGGATSSFTAPGHESQFSFRALNAGLYVYHCATAPVGLHVANGMYGLILVEPPEGLPPVDREFYVMQGDFYTAGRHGEKGLQPFDMEKAVDERPTYVVFNGAEGALAGRNALQARVGDRIRMFVGNGGPGLTSSFHVIGEIFDKVFTEGGTRSQDNVQTTVVPPGGAAVVELALEAPGSYVLVDHALFRAFNKGATGVLQVDGAEQKDVYSGKQRDTIYAGGEAPAPPGGGGELTGEERFAAGKALFSSTCAPCHQAQGQGVPGAIPPLAGSDFLLADKQRAIGIVLGGLRGAVKVNGNTYNGAMPPFIHLSDTDVASILTYVLRAWGNTGEPVTAAEVKAMRAQSDQPSGAEP